MPSVSKKQHNLMAAVANNPQFAKKVGIKQSVGKDFLAADKGKKFSGGGEMKRLFKGKETAAEEMKEAKALKSGKISKAQYVAGEKSEGHGKGAAKTASAIKSGKISPKQYAQAETMMKKGGCTKMAAGGKAKPDVKIAMSAKKPIPTKPNMTPPAMPRTVGASKVAGRPQVMPVAGAVPRPPMMSKGGLSAGHKSADGITKRGKTKGAEVKMARGGKTKKYC